MKKQIILLKRVDAVNKIGIIWYVQIDIILKIINIYIIIWSILMLVLAFSL